MRSSITLDNSPIFWRLFVAFKRNPSRRPGVNLRDEREVSLILKSCPWLIFQISPKGRSQHSSDSLWLVQRVGDSCILRRLADSEDYIFLLSLSRCCVQEDFRRENYCWSLLEGEATRPMALRLYQHTGEKFLLLISVSHWCQRLGAARSNRLWRCSHRQGLQLAS